MRRTFFKNVPSGRVYDWLSEILTPASLKDEDMVDLTRFKDVDEPKLYKKGLKIKAKTVPFTKQTDYYQDYKYLIKTNDTRIDEIEKEKIGGVGFAKYKKVGNFIFSLKGDVLQKLFPDKVPEGIDGVFVKTHLINYREGIYTLGFVEIVIHSRLNLLREKFKYNGIFYPVCYNYTQLFDVMVSKNDIRSLNIFDSQKDEMHEARMYYKIHKFKNGKRRHERNKKIETSNYSEDFNESEIVESNKYIQGYDVYAVAFMEMVSGDQKDLFGTEFPIESYDNFNQCEVFVKEQKKILLQLLYALYCGHEWFKFAHRDCHSSNVMYKEFDNDESKTVNIIIPRQGENDSDLFFKFETKHFVKIIDFGYSKTDLPDEQTQTDDFDRKLIDTSLEKFGKKNKEYGFKGFLQPFVEGALLFSDLAKFFTTSLGDRNLKKGRPLYKSWKMLYHPKLDQYAKDLKKFVADLFKQSYLKYKGVIRWLHSEIKKIMEQDIDPHIKSGKIVGACFRTGQYKYTRFITNIVTKATLTLKYYGRDCTEEGEPISLEKQHECIQKKVYIEMRIQEKNLKLTIEQQFERMATTGSKENMRSQEIVKCLTVEPEKYLEMMKTHEFFDDIRMKGVNKKIDIMDDYTFVYREKPKYNKAGRFTKEQVEQNPGLEEMFMEIKNNEI